MSSLLTPVPRCLLFSIDVYSWGLVFLLTKTLRNTLLLLTTRPLPRPYVPAFNKMLRLKYTHRIVIDVLPPEAVIALACSRLHVRSLPLELQTLLVEKAQGHPVYVEEVVKAMRDTQMIEVDTASGTVTVVAAKREELLTDTVQGVMVGRVDRLPADLLLTLKVCSVLGKGMQHVSPLSDCGRASSSSPSFPLPLFDW